MASNVVEEIVETDTVYYMQARVVMLPVSRSLSKAR